MMKTTLCVFVACGLVAGGATAQQPAPAPAPTPLPERPALKLKLEEPPARSEPRITFGPREGTLDTRSTDTLLPELGGRPSAAYERPYKAEVPGSPYPKDENPGR